MFMELTRAWVSDTGEWVYLEIHGDRGFEERYSPDNMSSQTTYFYNALDAFRAMEKWHEDERYEEVG